MLGSNQNFRRAIAALAIFVVTSMSSFATTLVSTYDGADGSKHTVSTDCDPKEDGDACAKRHAKALTAMKKSTSTEKAGLGRQ